MCGHTYYNTSNWETRRPWEQVDRECSMGGNWKCRGRKNKLGGWVCSRKSKWESRLVWKMETSFCCACGESVVCGDECYYKEGVGSWHEHLCLRCLQEFDCLAFGYTTCYLFWMVNRYNLLFLLNLECKFCVAFAQLILLSKFCIKSNCRSFYFRRCERIQVDQNLKN